MANIKFDHSAETLSGALGISDERRQEIGEAAQDAVTAKILTDVEINNISKMLEKALNECKPQGEAELVLLVFLVGAIHEELSELHKKVARFACIAGD